MGIRAVFGSPRMNGLQNIIHLSVSNRGDDTRIVYRLASSAADQGYQVELITGAEKIAMSPSWLTVTNVGCRRNRFYRMIVLPWIIFLEAMKRPRRAIFHLHNPPLAPVAILMTLFGRRVVWDVHEDFGASLMSRDYIPRRLRPLASSFYSAIERWVAGRVFACTAAWPSIARRLRMANGRTALVRNLYNGQVLDARKATTSKLVLYTGLVTRDRGIIDILDALTLLSKRFPDVELHIFPWIIEPEVSDLLNSHPACGFVRIREPISLPDLIKRMSEYAAGFALYHDIPNHQQSQPNKIFEFMAMGLPVIASDRPMLREIVHTANAGYVVQDGHAEEIASAVAELFLDTQKAAAFGNNGISAVRRQYSWSSDCAELLKIYEEGSLVV